MENCSIKAAISSAPSTCLGLFPSGYIHVCCFTEEERLIAGLGGIEFPNGTDIVEWPVHNVKTYKPFTTPPKGENKVRQFPYSSILNLIVYFQGRCMG